MSRTVRVLSFEAEPAGDHTNCGAQPGAFINVYITSESADGAREVARREVADAGWRILKATTEAVVTEHSFVQSPEGLQSYKQCIQDGLVIVVHTWQSPSHLH